MNRFATYDPSCSVSILGPFPWSACPWWSVPQGIGLEKTRDVIRAMTDDVLREAAGEIVDSKEAQQAIGRRTAELFKARVKQVPVP